VSRRGLLSLPPSVVPEKLTGRSKLCRLISLFRKSGSVARHSAKVAIVLSSRCVGALHHSVRPLTVRRSRVSPRLAYVERKNTSPCLAQRQLPPRVSSHLPRRSPPCPRSRAHASGTPSPQRSADRSTRRTWRQQPRRASCAPGCPRLALGCLASSGESGENPRHPRREALRERKGAVLARPPRASGVAAAVAPHSGIVPRPTPRRRRARASAQSRFRWLRAAPARPLPPGAPTKKPQPGQAG